MSRPAPPSEEGRDAKRQRADAALGTAPPPSVTTSTGSRATAELTMQPQSLPSQSVAQRCHTDALHCIFAFLGLKELLPALHSCRSWLAAGCKEPPRGLKLKLEPESFAALAVSPLRHHAAHLIPKCPVDLNELRQLRTLPRLTALNVDVLPGKLEAFLKPAGGSRQQHAQLLSSIFSTQLRSFGLDIQYDYDEPASLRTRQAAVDALPSAPSLHAVKLRCTIDDLDLSPLLQLPQLSDLTMSHSPSLAQCAAVKQLAALTALSIVSRNWRTTRCWSCCGRRTRCSGCRNCRCPSAHSLRRFSLHSFICPR